MEWWRIRDSNPVLPGGCGLELIEGAKSFVVVKRKPGGRPSRVTLGKYGHLTVDQARVAAQQALAQITLGNDINGAKRRATVEAKRTAVHETETVRWSLEKYKTEQVLREKGGRAGTLRSLNDTFNYFDERPLVLLKESGQGETRVWVEDGRVVLTNWLDRPLRSITPDEVLDRFDHFGRSRPSRNLSGPLRPIQRTHQIAFHFLSAAFNFVIPHIKRQTGEQLVNPVEILKDHKRFKATNKRSRFLDFEKAEFAVWWDACVSYRERNPVAADFIMFSLPQAGRSIEASAIKWDDVDLEKQVVYYDDTKNREDYAFPLSSTALDILRRCETRRFNAYVFGYEASATGHVPSDSGHHFEQIAKLGAKYISSHDLRRTWGSAAWFLDIDERTINYCLKHKIGDVNERYLMRNQEKIRRAFQDVDDYFVSRLTSDSTPMRTEAQLKMRPMSAESVMIS